MEISRDFIYTSITLGSIFRFISTSALTAVIRYALWYICGFSVQVLSRLVDLSKLLGIPLTMISDTNGDCERRTRFDSIRYTYDIDIITKN